MRQVILSLCAAFALSACGANPVQLFNQTHYTYNQVGKSIKADCVAGISTVEFCNAAKEIIGASHEEVILARDAVDALGGVKPDATTLDLIERGIAAALLTIDKLSAHAVQQEP